MSNANEVVYAFGGLPAGMEWIAILIVALLLFGRRLPEIMRGLGSSVRSFRRGMDEDELHPQTPPAPPVDGAVSRPADPTRLDSKP